MRLVWRGLWLGCAFGAAAAIVELGFGLIGVLSRGFGGSVVLSAKTAALQIALGAALGVALSPVQRARPGRWLHLLVLAVIWYALERWVALDSPLFAPLVVIAPAGAFALVSLGIVVARRRPAVAWGAGLALLAAAVCASPVALRMTRPALVQRAERPAPPAGAPDVVLIVLDTVRAANVSTYGYGRATAPFLTRLAGEGALFVDATSPSTWSLPSHASLFTGRYPSSHGAHAEHRYLDDRFPTLAQVLQAHGYETYVITANPWISDGLGLTRGFDWQDDSVRGEGGGALGFSFVHRLLDRLGLLIADKGGAAVASRFESWARQRPADAERPAFVFLNFIEAHFPYHQLPRELLFRFTSRPYQELRQLSVDLVGAQFGGPGRPVDEAREPAVDMYDGGVAYSDALLERVVDALRARGRLDQTVLVVLADHGEILGERGGYFGHGPSLYQQAVGVPLLVRYPPLVPAGTRVEAPVSTVGVFGTIADLAGLEPPPTLQVPSLAPLIGGGPPEGGGPILSELHDPSEFGATRPSDDPQMQSGRRYRLLRDGSWKLVVSSGGDALLYDLARDPAESRSLADERPEELARMQARLAEVEEALALPALDRTLTDSGEGHDLDDVTRERLRALGYAE